MVTVLALGDIFAVLTGGAVLGWRLSTKEGALMTNSRGTILLDERETSGRNLG
jgi:hypothetical protein